MMSDQGHIEKPAGWIVEQYNDLRLRVSHKQTKASSSVLMDPQSLDMNLNIGSQMDHLGQYLTIILNPRVTWLYSN